MSDDSQEFMEVAKNTKKPRSNKARSLSDTVLSLKMDDEPEPKVGRLCQYAMVEAGYIPTTTTIKKLPADCYKISHTANGMPYLDPQKLTTDELMRLPDSKSDEVVNEVNRFWTLKSTFKEYGFAHKRGFLLFGPPGSGKTSTVQIIINNMIKNDGIVILADHPGILDFILQGFRSVEPDRQLVVIWEDIDTVIMNYGESKVLSILDGESQIENVVFIATTNYPENLDGRIINRPSRFDKIVKIGMPNAEAREMYLKKKLGTTTAKDGTDLVKASDGFSIAHLKELIIGIYCQGNAPAEVINRLKKMKVTPTSAEDNNKLGIGF
jgi:hypothetical protein